jgi:hypothetical protein
MKKMAQIYSAFALLLFACETDRGGRYVPVPKDFYEAATQVHTQYPPFRGQTSLEDAATVVVVGRPVALAQGATWLHRLGVSRSTVMSFAIDEVVKNLFQ